MRNLMLRDEQIWWSENERKIYHVERAGKVTEVLAVVKDVSPYSGHDW